MSERYVVSTRLTGLGDRLICLCAAWIHAKNTGRTLVANGSRTRYLSEEGDLFSNLFDLPNEIGGTIIKTSADIAIPSLPRPVFPAQWDANFSQLGDHPPDAFPEERDFAVAMIKQRRDVDEPTIIFNTCIAAAVSDFSETHQFYSALKFKPIFYQAVDAFLGGLPMGLPLIGLHIRHGNGGNIFGHATAWTSFAEAIERCRIAVISARETLGKDAAVFLCTDSLEVELTVRAAIPNVITRKKLFRKPGLGELHLSPGSHAGLFDAVVEMMVLSRCDAVIRYPRESFYSQYAAIMKSRLTAPATIEELSRPHDPRDPLSPAIVI